MDFDEDYGGSRLSTACLLAAGFGLGVDRLVMAVHLPGVDPRRDRIPAAAP